jgi:hypothetical protein
MRWFPCDRAAAADERSDAYKRALLVVRQRKERLERSFLPDDRVERVRSREVLVDV